MTKVFISVYPFGEVDPRSLDILNEANIEYTKLNLKRKLKPEETALYAADCDGIIAGTEDLSELVQTSSKLKAISRVGIGLDSVPLDMCREKNIIVHSTPDAVTPAVVELTVGVMINIMRFVHQADHLIKSGGWNRLIGKRIGESIIGIIGVGRVGSGVIQLLAGFQPKEILLNDILDKKDIIKKIQVHFRGKIRQTTKEEIYNSADIISLHTPLTEDTRNMINEESLSLFKRGSFLINQARGGLIDEEALYKAIKNEYIQGAALDVFKKEPYKGKLTRLKNILLTAHMGSCSVDCRIKMETEAAENMIRALM